MQHHVAILAVAIIFSGAQFTEADDPLADICLQVAGPNASGFVCLQPNSTEYLRCHIPELVSTMMQCAEGTVCSLPVGIFDLRAMQPPQHIRQRFMWGPQRMRGGCTWLLRKLHVSPRLCFRQQHFPRLRTGEFPANPTSPRAQPGTALPAVGTRKERVILSVPLWR